MGEEAVNSFALLLETGQRLLDELESILESSGVRQRDELLKHQPAVQELNFRPRKAAKSYSRPIKEVQNNSATATPLEETPDVQETDVITTEDAQLPLAREDPATGKAIQNQPTIVKEQLPHLTESDALRLSQRKRKTVSACSIGDNRAAKYRSRSMVVVYYDGEIQQRFEAAVREIGVCRNSLRKGKMSARMESTFLDELKKDSEDMLDEDAFSPIKLKSYSCRLRSHRLAPDLDKNDAFEKADSFLDKAQAMCEQAAHQILRDGDCSTEIESAKEHIGCAIDVGKAELPMLQSKTAKAAQRRKQMEADQSQLDSGGLTSENGDVALSECTRHDSRRISPPDALKAGVLETDVLEAEELEADSSAEESDPSLNIVDMLRLGKFSTSATTRTALGAQAAA